MRKMTYVGLPLAVCLALLLVSGCGGGSEVDLAAVTGTVTLDGKPLANAQVEFQPKAEGSPSAAVTDAAGKYTLLYTSSQAGALVGDHVVVITGPAAQVAEGMDEDDAEPGKELASFPRTVESGGSTIDFALTSGEDSDDDDE